MVRNVAIQCFFFSVLHTAMANRKAQTSNWRQQ